MVPQEIAVYPLLTARENLEAFGRLHGVRGAELKERVAWALEWTGLADARRRAGAPLLGRHEAAAQHRLRRPAPPEVVLLDEPTVGVDPQSRERIYDMLDGLRREGASLLLTTHHLEEAEARCERIVIMDHGKVAATGTAPEMVSQVEARADGSR